MYINDLGFLVIDDKYICEFVKMNPSTELLEMAENILKTLLMMSHNVKNNKTDLTKEIISYIENNKSEIISAINTKREDFTPLVNCVVENKKELVGCMKNFHETEKAKLDAINSNVNSTYDLNKANFQNLQTKITSEGTVSNILEDNKINSDFIVQNIDYYAEKTKNKIEELKNSKDIKLIEDTGVIKDCIQRLDSKIDSFMSLRKTNKDKGTRGETELMACLEYSMPAREGYRIEDVSAIPHNCDMCVKRIGYPNIRIEVKAYGQENKINVPTTEVRKFENDLIGLDNHGIFVSLYTGICGKSQVEINVLQNNKIAVYLSNNNFDADIIRDFVCLIYKIDYNNSNGDGFKIDPKILVEIKNILGGYCIQIKTLKSHLRSSVEIVNEMSFDRVLGLISGAKIPISQEEKDSFFGSKKHLCGHCKNNYASKAGLISHEKICKAKTSLKTLEEDCNF